jgi:hypothetical protein
VKAITLCCAVALVVGSQAIGTPQSPPVMPEWGAPNEGLRMAISSLATRNARPEERQFHVAIDNIGDRDVMINLGDMVANEMSPQLVRLVLTDPQGATRELRWFDRRGGAPGRADDFLVALRAGSVYLLRLSLDRYYSPATREYKLKLARGQYRIEARFDGQGARFLNSDTPGIAHFNFWKGMLRSNSLAFQVP